MKIKSLLFKLFFGKRISLDYIHKELHKIYPQYGTIILTASIHSNYKSEIKASGFKGTALIFNIDAENYNSLLAKLKLFHQANCDNSKNEVMI